MLFFRPNLERHVVEYFCLLLNTNDLNTATATVLGFHVTSSKLKEIRNYQSFWDFSLVSYKNSWRLIFLQIFSLFFLSGDKARFNFWAFACHDYKMVAENAVTWVTKGDLYAEISQSEQSLYENKYSCRCLWVLRRRLLAFYIKLDTCFC